MFVNIIRRVTALRAVQVERSFKAATGREVGLGMRGSFCDGNPEDMLHGGVRGLPKSWLSCCRRMWCAPGMIRWCSQWMEPTC